MTLTLSPVSSTNRLRALRHDATLESFTWGAQRWNISQLLLDLQDGALRPVHDCVERDFLESYAQALLGQRRDCPPTPDSRRASLMMHVDAYAALQMPTDVLKKPLVLLDAGASKGFLTLPGRPDASFVLADGNHRICKAFFEGVATLPTIQLSLAQSKRYRC